jgi:two-component system phosphate regulon sensor histidine kinase PhoR
MISAVAILLVTGLAVSYVYYFEIQMDMEDELRKDAKLLMYLNAYDIQNLRADDIRVTIIKEDGTVQYDSDYMAKNLDNHNDRPEVIEARVLGEAYSIRVSDTDTFNVMYYAKLNSDGSVIRLGKSTSMIYDVFIQALLNVFIILVCLFVISYFIVGWIVKRVTKPINEIDLITTTEAPYPEFEPLINTIVTQRKELNSQIEQFRIRNDMVMAIVSNMQEGLIIIDRSGVMISANRSVFDIFDLDVNFSYRNISEVFTDDELLAKAKEATGGAHFEMEFQRFDKYYRVYMSPLKEVGAIIIFFDVTGVRNAENLRLEFSANVSHELRTPLTTISGYAEMIESGLARPEDITDFAAKISVEAARLLDLIEDIIVLSALDENPDVDFIDEIDLAELSNKIGASLDLRAQEKNVSIDIGTTDLVIMGKMSMIYELIYNLMENAVKYNKKGGSVSIVFDSEDDNAIIVVSDTGPGIAKEHQARIFERFYRVENSRGKKTGGTGLGLAISQNIVTVHSGSITVHSAVGQGTEFVVTLPVHQNNS